jgi:hypothetical protein
MSIFVIYSCEVIALSFLIGTFMSSPVLGFTICGMSGLIMYALYQKFYTPLPLIWGTTLLAGLNGFLWASYLDTWFGTTFIAIIAGTLTAVYFYYLNKKLFSLRKHP